MITRCLWAAATVAALTSGCGGKNSDSDDKDNTPASSDPGSTSPTNTGAGTSTTTNTPPAAKATLTLGARAIAAQGDFLAELASSNANATAGSLLLSLGLRESAALSTNDSSHLALLAPSAYRAPVNNGYSIASGAPDEMIIYIKRIELLRDAPSSGDDEPEGPASLKSQHVGLFDAQHASALTPLVGVTYDNPSLLLQAIAQATGLGPDAVQNALTAAYQAGELNVDDAVAGIARSLVFSSDTGAPLKIASGKVDMSELFAAAGNNGEFKVDAGTYRAVKVVFANKAKVKGCVPMRFECRTAQGDNRCSTNTSSADIPGNQGQTPPEDLLYCTQADHSPFVDTTSQNSDFLNKTPELMDFPIGMTAAGWPNVEDLDLDFAIGSALELKKDDKLNLTMAVDLNRMLRYYNRGRTDQGPTPAAPKDRAYFFTSIFKESVYVFAGEAGRVYSYEALANVCGEDDTYNAQSDSCGSTAQNQRSKVGFAVTIISKPDGSPLIVSMQPDDDNDLTITKGTIREHARCPSDNNANWARASAAGNDKVDIHWALCDNDSQTNQPGPYGKLIGFPAALDGVTPAAATIPFADADTTGLFRTGIESILRQQATDPSKTRRGKVDLRRRL